MKTTIIAVAILISSFSMAQAFQTNGFGDILLRRYAGGDTTFKRAMVVFPTKLFINFNEDFRDGVIIGGSNIILNGNVGIGSNNPDEKLTVKGKIHAEEVRVDLQVPADYVFQKYFNGVSDLKTDYEMLPFKDLEEYVKTNNHLPGVPSAQEIQDNGLNLGQMNNLLLEKIEELTLYTIEQQKAIDALKEEIDLLKENNSSK